MKKLIGEWLLHQEPMRLYGSGGTDDGHAHCPDKRSHVAWMVVGLAGTWGETLDNLLHEAFEFALFRLGCCYGNNMDADSRTEPGRMMVMTHGQYQEAMTRAAAFLVDAIQAVAATHRKYHASLRVKNRKESA